MLLEIFSIPTVLPSTWNSSLDLDPAVWRAARYYPVVDVRGDESRRRYALVFDPMVVAEGRLENVDDRRVTLVTMEAVMTPPGGMTARVKRSSRLSTVSISLAKSTAASISSWTPR